MINERDETLHQPCVAVMYKTLVVIEYVNE